MPTILIVDDDDTFRVMAVALLEANGYVVIEAADGRQGIDVARADQPDLIIMDLRMPLLDGWAAIPVLKSDESTSHIPVIALTAASDPRERSLAQACGCDDYLNKPLQPTALLERIAALVA